jgi:hypothetical protein
VWRVGMPMPKREHGKKADHVSEREKPALPHPLHDRSCLWIEIRQGHSRRGAEPNHRPTKSDGVGEETPVISALIDGQRGEREVVEDG